jgi:molybdopterin-synthase adenylyltransferase
VQISRDDATPIDLERIVARLSPLGAVSRNEWLVRAHIEGYDLTIFADGRTLVSGTSDPAVARSLVARFVGA